MGNFFSGLAEGIERGRDYNLRKKQQENSDKQTQWAEDDHNAKVASRKREDDFRASYGALYQKTYGEQEVDDPAQVGNLSAPKLKKTYLPGQDVVRDTNFYIDTLALKQMHGDPDPELLMKASKTVQELKSSEFGKNLMGAIGGDENAKQQLFKAQGIDPATAKLEVDPLKGIFRLVTPQGAQDLRQIAVYLGADKAYKMMTDQTEEARKGEKHGLEVKEGNLKVDQLIPAQISEAKAGSGLKGAQARMYNAETDSIKAGKGRYGNVGSSKDPNLIASIEKLVPAAPGEKAAPHHIRAVLSIYDAMGEKAGPNGRQVSENRAATLYSDELQRATAAARAEGKRFTEEQLADIATRRVLAGLQKD